MLGRSAAVARGEVPVARTNVSRVKARLGVMVWKREVSLGVIIADAANERIKEIGVVRNLSILNIGCDEVAEEAPEVLVAGIGEKERESVSMPTKRGRRPMGRGSGSGPSSRARVSLYHQAEPHWILAGWDLPGTSRRLLQRGVVARVEVVENGLGQCLDTIEAIEKPE